MFRNMTLIYHGGLSVNCVKERRKGEEKGRRERKKKEDRKSRQKGGICLTPKAMLAPLV